MSVSSNLYPPIISTYMPAFIRTEKCKITFSLSSLNKSSDIKNVQMIVKYQSNNLSALDDNKYFSEIKICSLNVDTSDSNTYYVELLPEDLETGIFENNQFYQIQLRFTDKQAENVPANGKIENWLIENNKYFSEWSTVCLIKGIDKPELNVNNFTLGEENTYQSDLLTVAATLNYEDSSENEKIKSYNLKLYSQDKEKLLEESGQQFTADSFNFNEINYTFRMELIDKTNYVLTIEYNTYNNYSETLDYTFKTNIDNKSFTFDMTLVGESNEELGINTLTFDIQNVNTDFSGNFLIKRSSSEDEFKYWDTIYYLHIPAYNVHRIQFLWDDLTPKLGVWYKYAVQYVDLEGNKSELIKELNDTIFVLFSEESFLVENSQMLTLRYDTQISSIRENTADSIIQTLGSQYPYMRRNGNIDYKTFPLSGTITLLSDDGERFKKKKDLLKNDFQNNEYQKYIEEKNITLEMNDTILEREFREFVIKFLKDGKVKLFRSLQEGNILVRLTDVNLTPNPTLGRRIYSFSATATEIGADTVDNYFKYNLSNKTLKKPIYEIYLRVKKYDKKTDTITIKSSQVVNDEKTLILNRRIIGYEDIEGNDIKW